MFDFHNHFTDIKAFKYTDVLLPQKITLPYSFTDISSSEIGLDARFKDRMPMQLQVEILTEMLLYAKKHNIPVSLHCVHATGLLLDILKNVKPLPLKTVWHGFNLSKEVGAVLYKIGVIISIGPSFNKNLKDIYDSNPNLVLETDYTGCSIEEYNSLLQYHFTKCANDLGFSIIELEEIINEKKRSFTS